jgi:hypothetical protein
MPRQFVAELGFVVTASAWPPGLAGIALNFDITFIMDASTGAIRIGVGRRSVRRYEVGLVYVILRRAIHVLWARGFG